MLTTCNYQLYNTLKACSKMFGMYKIKYTNIDYKHLFNVTSSCLSDLV